MSKQLTPVSYDAIVRELFDTRVAAAQKIAAGCARYLGTIADFIRGSDPAEYTRINSALESIYTMGWPELDIAAASPAECLSHWADVFDQLNILDNNVSVSVSILTTAEYLRKAIQQTSTTTVNIYQERSHILALYDAYRTADYDKIVAHIDRVGIDGDTIRKFALERDKFNQITAHIMRGVIGESSDSATTWRLHSRIEELKNEVLGSTRELPMPPTMSRFGLVPVSRVLTAEKMAEFLGIDLDVPATNSADIAAAFQSAIEKAVAKTAHGAVLIYLGLPNATQLEFNLSGLIDADYVLENDLKTVSGTGLTKKVIERLSTINRLPRDAESSQDNKSPPFIKVYGEKRTQYWVIQMVIGGGKPSNDGPVGPLYRMLGYGYLAGAPSTVYAPMITGLIRGYTSRPEDYNEIHADTILSTVYDSEIKTILSAYTVTKLQSPSSDLIRAKILDEMTDRFLADHSKRPMTAKTIRSRAVDVDFIENLLIATLMPNPTKNYTERVLTAVAKVDTVSRVFINELEKRWMSAVIPDRTFREYTGPGLIEQLRGIFINTVSAAIDELERAGTWASLEPSLKEFYFEYKSDRT